MLSDKTLCTGCGACTAVCPSSCISLKPDNHGFLYPVINDSLCNACEICESVCPALHTPTTHDAVMAYAAKNNNVNDRLSATSGGVFQVLALWILEAGGVVFGAAYDDDFSVKHICVDNPNDLKRLSGSKYSQSETGITFEQTKQYLELGRKVLYSGTACQIMGLKNYLGIQYDNLLCVDLICHGVPSPKVWQHYIDYRSSLDNSCIRPISINQRSKVTGWSNYSIVFNYNSNMYTSPARYDPYIQGFVKNLYLRESCFHCIGKGLNRTADITIGDYWGVDSQHSGFNDDKGVSLVLLHSDKAVRIWEKNKHLLTMMEVNAFSAIKDNPMIVQSTTPNPASEDFWEHWKETPFEELIWSLISKPNLENNIPLFLVLKTKAVAFFKRFQLRR